MADRCVEDRSRRLEEIKALLHAFLCTFPHALPVLLLSTTCAVFALVNHFSSDDIDTADIDTAGLQRMLSQEVLASILLSRLAADLTGVRAPGDIFETLFAAQDYLHQQYDLPGETELASCFTSWTTNATSTSLFDACNEFRDVADDNVKFLVADAKSNVRTYVIIITSLCIIEILVICVLMYLTSRNQWVDRLKQQAAELKHVEQLNSAVSAGHQSTMRSLSHDLKGATVNTAVNVEVLMEFSKQHPHPDPIIHEMGTAVLEQVLINTRHVQCAIKAVQLLVDLTSGENLSSDRSAPFSLHDTIRDLALRYPQLEMPAEIPETFKGEETAIYHVLHNAVRNAVKHGGPGPVALALTEDEGATVLQLTNNPGPNHAHMLKLQSARGSNWLVKDKAETFALSSDGIGLADSTYQGMRDIRTMLGHLKAEGSIDFLPNAVVFMIKVPGLRSIPSLPVQSIQNESTLCVLCADDQNAPRLQVLNAISKLGVPLQQKRTMQDVKGGLFRDEPQVKIFGREASEIAIPAWEAVVKEWQGKPTVLILDQNLDFGAELIKGTDICRTLRGWDFNGVIAIRSGNDSREDTKKYLLAGADAVLSKTTKVDELADAIRKLGTMARMRCAFNSQAQGPMPVLGNSPNHKPLASPKIPGDHGTESDIATDETAIDVAMPGQVYHTNQKN